MKTKLNSDDDLPLNKLLKFHLMTIIVRCVFSEDRKLYPKLFLDDTLYELVLKMLQYFTIDFSEGIDVNKTSVSKECGLCHYRFFKDVGFKFEEHVCNGCHDLSTMGHSLKNITMLSVKKATFRFLLMSISKTEALEKLNNSVTYDRGVL